MSKLHIWNYETGKHEFVGAEYPKVLGTDVAKWRALARTRDIGRDGMRRYGEAVEIAIRKLQRTELMRSLTPTPSLARPAIKRSTSPLTVAYSKPNPFRMVGDPADRDEESLYKQLVRA